VDHASEFRRCLEVVDIDGIRKLWAHVSPHLPQPQSDAEALVTIHQARTQAKSVAFNLRAYSHRWLTDNGYPSGLPDDLKPSAERVYPKIVEAVGISVNFRTLEFRPVANLVRGAMSDAVMESFADRVVDPVKVSAHMAEAKRTAVRKLLGV
jgi:hypothetical protein